VAAARTTADAAGHQLDAARLQVEGQVAQDYYQLVANLALVAASQTALVVALSDDLHPEPELRTFGAEKSLVQDI